MYYLSTRKYNLDLFKHVTLIILDSSDDSMVFYMKGYNKMSQNDTLGVDCEYNTNFY